MFDIRVCFHIVFKQSVKIAPDLSVRNPGGHDVGKIGNISPVVGPGPLVVVKPRRAATIISGFVATGGPEVSFAVLVEVDGGQEVFIKPRLVVKRLVNPGAVHILENSFGSAGPNMAPRIQENFGYVPEFGEKILLTAAPIQHEDRAGSAFSEIFPAGQNPNFIGAGDLDLLGRGGGSKTGNMAGNKGALVDKVNSLVCAKPQRVGRDENVPNAGFGKNLFPIFQPAVVAFNRLPVKSIRRAEIHQVGNRVNFHGISGYGVGHPNGFPAALRHDGARAPQEHR